MEHLLIGNHIAINKLLIAEQRSIITYTYANNISLRPYIYILI